ncbi:MAG TPA: IS110 family transposase [Edaphobacter sp.]|uniref:IS110 family transposase n=1 Tax=Edaphobacter sp. TaxID=1934404 RepID=UPI002C8D2A65|nr:IS110 family transposase [Edaphobacter sp.]HUZ95272.1 IS110 family transposase [Edaphobacter sp.]
MKRYLGVDLHRTQFTVCTRWESGRTYLRQWPIKELKLFAGQLRKGDEIAVEATGNTRLFYDAVVEHVERVAVVNPAQFKVISQSVKKTDRNDAELLALYLAKGLLPEVRMKERNQREMSHLAQTRDLLVKQRSALKAKINNLLSAEGINLKREALSSNKALERVLTLPLSPLMRAELRVLAGQIRSLNGSIAELEEMIEEEGPRLAGHENLMSIKGIGPVSAAVLLSVIGDIRDFSDPGKLAAYLGLVPRVANSNETEHSGHITKQGNKLARTTLVQCALIAKRYSSYLQQFYQRIQRRRGGGKANIALARKFLGVIYYTLKNNWVFEDFPNFVLAS